MDPLEDYRVGTPVVIRRTGDEGRVHAVYPDKVKPIRIGRAVGGDGPTVFSPHELRIVPIGPQEHSRLRRLEEAVIALVIADMDGTDPREKQGLYLRVALLSGVEDRRTMGRIPHDFDPGPWPESIQPNDCWLCGEGAQFYNHTDRNRSDDGT